MIKKLNDSQVAAFDTESMNDFRLGILKSKIDKYFPDGKFTFADLGCGNGFFADGVLDEYPNATAILLDNSDYILSKNKNVSRKTIVCDSIMNASLHIKNVDIVFMNWVLHHLVSNTYKESYSNINKALTLADSLLKNNGNSFISIFECMYNGLFLDSFPSYFIYQLSSNKMIAPIARKINASSAVAGVGVLFLSKKQWEKAINKADLNIIQYTDDEAIEFPAYQKIILHLGKTRQGHFWVSR